MLPMRITWDHNPFRVGHAFETPALCGVGAGKEVTLECRSVVRIVKEMSSYRGGKWFCDDIETSSPCVEGIMSYLGSEGKLMDEDDLLAEVYTETSRIRISDE